MKLKYVILNEVNLEIVYDKENLIPMIFSSKEQAIEYAEKNIQGYQVIEVPFGD